MRFPAAYALAFATLAVGYGVGWYIHEGSRPEAYFIAFFIGILIAVGSSWPIRFWISWLNENQSKQEYISNELDRMERKKDREEKLKEIRNRPAKKSNEAFDEEDFDEASKAMLLKFVREARKAGAKVTGQGLVGGVLKSIH